MATPNQPSLLLESVLGQSATHLHVACLDIFRVSQCFVMVHCIAFLVLGPKRIILYHRVLRVNGHEKNCSWLYHTKIIFHGGISDQIYDL